MARQVIANAISKRGVAERSRRSATRIQAMGISIAGAASMTRRAMEIEQIDKILNIYAQRLWHYDAYIAGTRDGLETLRNAIDMALLNGAWQTAEYASDGEVYAVNVVVVTDEQAGSMVVPYTDEVARYGDNDIGLRPWEIQLL